MKKLPITCTLALLCFTSFAGKKSNPSFVKAVNPNGFVENKGQMVDQNSKPNPLVKYMMVMPDMKVQLREKGFSYELFTIKKEPEVITEGNTFSHKTPNFSGHFHRVDISFVNANPHPEMVPEIRSIDFSNYYTSGTSPSGITDVHSYKKVTYKNMYPKIDIVFYSEDATADTPQMVKYNFIIHPGGNLNNIKMMYQGADGLALNEEGVLEITTSEGKIKETIPASYVVLSEDNKTKLNVKFLLSKNTLSFIAENYDKTKTLIIDPLPNRIWGTYFGGNVWNEIYEMESDQSNNIFVGGASGSSGGIATGGVFQGGFSGGNSDGMIAKFNGSNGTRIWASFYGGSLDDNVWGMIVDNNGNPIITGRTQSTGMASGGAHQTSYAGGDDAIVAKFNGTNGTRQWGTYYGGSGVEWGEDIAVDASNNIYITGLSASSSSISTPGAYQVSASGPNDGMIVKFDPSGVRIWGTYYGGNDVDYTYGITLDNNSDIIIGGITSSTAGIASNGAHQVVYGGGSLDGMIAKLNNAGTSRYWGTYYGGSNTDFCGGMSLPGSGGVLTNSSNDIYVQGLTYSSNGIASVGAYQTVFGGGQQDAFLVKLNSSGVRQWGTFLGGSGNDVGTGLTLDGGGNALIVGYTTSSSSISTVGAYQTTFGGGSQDAFLAKFLPNGAVSYVTYVGGTGSEYGTAVTRDGNDNIYVAGCTDNSSGLTTVGTHQQTFSGSGDGFIEKFDNPCTLAPAQPGSISGSTSVCTGSGAGVYSVAVISDATSYTWSVPAGWSGSSATNTISASPGSSGIFTVTASNLCGTSVQRTLNVTVNALPTVGVNSGSICSGQTFTLQATGAATYVYSGGSNIVTPTTNTTYSVTGTSSVGCASSNTAIANVAVALTPTVTVPGATVCAGQNPTFTPQGAATYTYVSAGGPTLYMVIGQSIQGCISAPVFVTVTVNQLPTVSVNSGSICSGNVFTIVPTGASTYVISGGSNTVSPISNSSYFVTGTSSQGCVSSNTAVSNVTVVPLPVVTIVGLPAICVGNSATLTAVGANTYTWNNSAVTPSISVSPVITTTYAVVCTNSVGCQNSATRTVTVNPLPNVTASATSSVVCFGYSTILNGAGAIAYQWSGGVINNLAFTPTVTSIYTVTGTDLNNCKNTANILIVVNNLPNVTASASSTVICSGNPVTLTGGGALTYSWSGGITNNVSFNPTTSGNYVVTGTDVNSCQNIASIAITVNALPNVNASSNRDFICKGETATLTVNGANIYTWNTGESAASIVVSPSTTTNYTVAGTDLNGCSKSTVVIQKVDACAGIEQSVTGNDKVSVYPNPNNGVITIRLNNLSGNTTVEIYNVIGGLILNSVIANDSTDLNISEKTAGVYLVRVLQNGAAIFQKKVVKND